MIQGDKQAERAVSRRGFIDASLKGTFALIGTSMLTKRGWSRPADGPAANSVAVKTHEWFGDIEESLTFPSDWEISVRKMAGHDAPGMDAAAIRQRIQNPIGSKPLRELAEGKKNVVITFDDLTRPTPTYMILPIVIEELKAAGVRDEGILLLGSFGSHEVMSQSQVGRKLGQEIVRKYPWLNHTCFEHTQEVGVTSQGNRIRLNNHFVAADLRITISGIKPHGGAGYGGGGKAVLPGVASIDSICYIHSVIASGDYSGNRTTGVGKIYKNQFRQDLDEAARLAGVEFSVQVLYGPDRQPVGIFAGDIIDAYREACKKAVGHFRTEPATNADVVICNAYPQVSQANSSLSWASRSLRDGGTAVLIMQLPDGMSTWHGMSDRLRTSDKPYWKSLPKSEFPAVRQAQHVIVFSQYLQKRDVLQFSQKNFIPAYSWDDVLAQLKKNHPGGASAAVYPYAPLQHPPLELDGPA